MYNSVFCGGLPKLLYVLHHYITLFIYHLTLCYFHSPSSLHSLLLSSFEHSASIVLSWCDLGHLSGENLLTANRTLLGVGAVGPPCRTGGEELRVSAQ